MKEQVLQKHGKALVIYGAVHFYRTMLEDYLSSMGDDIGLARKLEINFPGRTFVVIPMGSILRTGSPRVLIPTFKSSTAL